MQQSHLLTVSLASTLLIGAATALIAQNGAPQFEVVSGWPKPLPNGWAVGPVSGITIDARDHVLITQRGEPREAGTSAAPPVIEFERTGQRPANVGAGLARATSGPNSSMASP